MVIEQRYAQELAFFWHGTAIHQTRQGQAGESALSFGQHPGLREEMQDFNESDVYDLIFVHWNVPRDVAAYAVWKVKETTGRIVFYDNQHKPLMLAEKKARGGTP